MNITKEQLIEAVRASTIRKRVLAPSTDYYARSGDTDTDTIEYVCGESLVQAIKDIAED